MFFQNSSRFFRPKSPKDPLPPPLSKLIKTFAGKHSKWLAMGTPWITDGATDWLDRNLTDKDTVLEFGIGRSTPYWASKARYVTCVEGSPDWTLWTLFHFYTRPALMKKIRLYFCPVEWNPDFAGKNSLRRYWTENRDFISLEDALEMERGLIAPDFPGHNVLFFDGNIRFLMFVHKMRTIDLSEVDIIVIDNTENATHSTAADIMIPDDFKRLDFAADPSAKLAAHQIDGHITSVWVRESRFQNDAPNATGDRRKILEKTINEIIAGTENYLDQKLGLS